MAEPLISFEASADGDSRIDLDARVRADRSINRLLFGKFTEHLGRNIYQGMWAQILQNASFSDWSYFRPMWRQGARGHSGGCPVDRVLAAYERGLGCWWLPYGRDTAIYLLDWADPFNSETSQRIAVPAPGEETGIAQIVYLPLHRARRYTASFHARGQVDALRISLVDEATGDTLAAADVAGVAEGWQRFEATLALPDGAAASGMPLAFRIGASEAGCFWLDQVFLFPDDHISGFDPDVIRLLRASRLPLLRYPGGNFVSGYHWRDGVGPIHSRPVRANPAWNIVEPNHVGTDEFMAFCKAVGCEPMICVNAGNGTPEEAAEWVAYCNGDAGTELGRLRAQNGHPDAYGVRYWEIGNEIYGRWQTGHCTPEEYAERYEAFRKAMLAVDPSLLLIANGQSLEWNRPLVARKGDLVRSLSLHTLIGGGGARQETDAERVYQALMGYTTAYDGHLQALSDQAKQGILDPKIAITELQIFTNVPHLPTNATQAESLFLAGIIHSALRQGDLVEMITHSALVNHGGGLRKEREVVYPNPVHWVSHLYGNLPEAVLVQTRSCGETFEADVSGITRETSAPYLDAVGALTADAGKLLLLAINRHPSQAIAATIRLEGFVPAPEGQMQTVAGAGYMSKNTLNDPDAVQIETSAVAVVGHTFEVTFRPHSVNVLTLSRSEGET